MVRTGLERLVRDESALVRGRRIGLLCHHASFTSDLVFALDALRAAGADVVRLFGPEHGPWGTAQDMIPVSGGYDPWTDMELVSLYGDTKGSLRPKVSAFDGLDALVIDLQDVGARYYTYACTAALAVEVAIEAGVESIVCDRPNPIGGLAVEGNLLQPECESFVGMYPIPQRHGLSFAELVKACVKKDFISVPMSGWRRKMWYDETGLHWIPPSPNMPTLTTAALYPGLCLIEGTNLSEGRGTTTPFELLGAPFIDPFALADALNGEGLPGVVARPHVFEPTFQKHQHQACGGVQLIVTDRHALQSVRLGVAILCVVNRLYPTEFQWRKEVYEFESDRLAIDLLLGKFGLRERIEGGATVDDVCHEWSEIETHWLDSRREYLLYDE